MPSSGGIWGFVLVFICVVVTFDVLYIHQKGFRQGLEAHGIGFGPPSTEPKQEKPWEKKQETNTEPEKKVEEVVEEKVVEVEEKPAENDPAEGETKDKEKQVESLVNEQEDDGHKVAGLSCKDYGGPSDEDAAEMVFWKDIPEDASFVSPYKRNETQYLTFEPGTYR